MWHGGAWVHTGSMLRVFDLDLFPTRFSLECHQLSTTISKLVIEISSSWFLVVSILFFNLWMFWSKPVFYPCFIHVLWGDEHHICHTSIDKPAIFGAPGTNRLDAAHIHRTDPEMESRSAKKKKFDEEAAIRSWKQIPSGKHAKSYWKLPCIVDFPIKNGDFP